MLIKILDIFLCLYFYFYLSIFITDYSFIFLSKRFAYPLENISNIVGPTIGLAFLLIIWYVISKKSFYESFFVNILKRIINLGDKKILSFASLILFVVLVALSIARHLALSSGASDMGIFDQAVWNAAHGNMLFSSLMNNMDLLGYHFYPILLFIVPIYKIWSNPIALLIVQSFLLASAMIPLYLIAKNRLAHRHLIFAFIISFVLSKPLRGVGLSDFHTECFIIPLLFWAYYFLISKKNLLFIFTLIFLSLCKEDVAFLISGLGVFAFFSQRRHKVGISIFLFGIFFWIITTKIIIPYFNPSHVYPYMSRLPFGLTYADNINTFINNPLVVIKFIFNKKKLLYCLKLFGPVGFISIFSPMHYILIAVPLLKNLLATKDFSGYYKISSHYTASIIPFIYISAIYGARWLVDKLHDKKNTSLFISLFLIVSSLLFYGKTDVYKFNRFLSTIKDNNTLKKISYLKIVPQNASVATNFNLVPHMSHRKYIFEWNPQAKTSLIVEYIVVDKNLLGCLSSDDVNKIELYFNNIIKLGYKQVFSSPDKKFLIFHNPNIDKSLVKKVSLISEK